MEIVVGGFLLALLVTVLVFAVAYLCACAGAQKWLAISEWWHGPLKQKDTP